MRKLKKNRQHNGQKKKDERTNNHLQNITHKTKDQVTELHVNDMIYLYLPRHWFLLRTNRSW
jgi:hypothetical protein